MSIVSDLEKLSSGKMFIYLTLFSATIASGFLFIFTFNRDMFVELDIVKLSILSFSISYPLILLNGVFVSLFLSAFENYIKVAKKEDEMHEGVPGLGLMLAAICTILLLSVTTFIGYWNSFDMKEAIAELLYFQFLLILILLSFQVRTNRVVQAIKKSEKK